MPSRVLQKGTNKITQGYKSAHKAVDLGRGHLTGEPVIAHSSGVVIFCQTGHKNNKGAKGNASYGNCVKLDHGDGYATLYAHLATVKVKNGEAVKQGQVIGTMGNTGNSYGIHLHFEVRKNNVHIDPTPYLDADLPKTEKPTVTYRAYTNRWLPWVTDYQNHNADGYAGVVGQPLSALCAKPSNGTLRYRLHVLGGGWLPWVTNDSDYAGIRGKTADAVQMELSGAPGYQVKYRVSPKANNGWYGWCTGITDATGDGYAGVFGMPIDLIQIGITEV